MWFDHKANSSFLVCSLLLCYFMICNLCGSVLNYYTLLWFKFSSHVLDIVLGVLCVVIVFVSFPSYMLIFKKFFWLWQGGCLTFTTTKERPWTNISSSFLLKIIIVNVLCKSNVNKELHLWCYFRCLLLGFEWTRDCYGIQYY